MKDFKNKIAVITGAGTGMGRELAIQLAKEGCHLAICDVIMENLTETKKICEEKAPEGTLISDHECDVSEEQQIIEFCESVKSKHQTEHINLLFNNAGISGGGSFIRDGREDWEKAFGVSWFGVYYCTRSFMPLLLKSTEGHIINTSSVNGFWACLGPTEAHTAYSSAKFAVKGFSEALIVDLRLNAPHIKVSLVMPGHIGTSIIDNTAKILGHHTPAEMSSEELAMLRESVERRGFPTDELNDEQVRALVEQYFKDFREKAPVTAAEAATIILDGVRNETWRILVGEDAELLDRKVRENPEIAYELSFNWGRG